jgi:hypothetical protein
MSQFILFVFFLFLRLSNVLAEECERPLKVLHLSMHGGCIREIEAIAKELAIDLTSWFVLGSPPGHFDEKGVGAAIYNIGHDRAERVWNKHRAFFESFDAILTSDTAPLSRIFLQNGWKKPLIIWICNRFDYSDRASIDCDFPDTEYYQLFSRAVQQDNVSVIAYTAIEHIYCRSKGIDTGTLTITPCGAFISKCVDSAIPSYVVKEETLFVTPYHNDTWFKVAKYCEALGFTSYQGRYNGPEDLKGFKAIVHIPYSWSNLALFENMQFGIPYFIPSKKFFRQFLEAGAFLPDPGFAIHHLEASEWYSPRHSALFTYFDSWEDLQYKIQHTDFTAWKARIQEHAKAVKTETIEKWKQVFQSAKRNPAKKPMIKSF